MSKIEKINLIMTYRPLSLSRIMSPNCRIVQREDGTWVADENVMRTLFNATKNDVDKLSYPKTYSSIGEVAYKDRRKIQDTIKMLNRNSSFRYNIIVAIDSDVFPNESFLKEFSNVKIFKSSYIPNISTDSKSQYNTAWWRINHAFNYAVQSIPDNEWICFAYSDDFLCPQNWDKDIISLIETEGNRQVYCPFLVEIGPTPAHIPNLIVPSEWEINYENIWTNWRKLGQSFLVCPPPKRGYINCSDLEEYVKIAKEPPPPTSYDQRTNSMIAAHGVTKIGKNIKEMCGMRIYSSLACLFVKSEHIKYAMSKSLIGVGWDMACDNYLGHGPNGAGGKDANLGLRLVRVVVGSSYLFHPSMEYREE